MWYASFLFSDPCVTGISVAWSTLAVHGKQDNPVAQLTMQHRDKQASFNSQIYNHLYNIARVDFGVKWARSWLMESHRACISCAMHVQLM